MGKTRTPRDGTSHDEPRAGAPAAPGVSPDAPRLGPEEAIALFDSAPIATFVLAPDGVIRDVSRSGARLLGVDRRHLVGSSLGRFVAERSRDQLTAFLERVLAHPAGEGSAASCDLALDVDGGRDAHLTGAAIAGPQALVTVEDVTRRTRAEAALRAESVHKDEFLAILSHELRNPLAPIRSCLEVLQRAEPGSAPARNARVVIERQVTQLAHMVDDLLDATRIAQGRVRLELARLELTELVRRTVEDYRPTFQSSGIELQLRLGALSLWVDADATRLVQVLGTLLGNANEVTPRGGRVHVGLTADADAVSLVVGDTGAGIDPAVAASVFEPFSREPRSLERAPGGLGLGLATAKGLVELHGGTIALESEGPGRGTTFTVRLPRALAPRADELTRPPQALVADTSEPRRLRILVIEDNEDAANSLRDVLMLDGHEVAVAHDGPTGLQLARELRPGVILCDIGLPGMDGYAVARAIRGDPTLRDTSLVALSGYAQPADLQKAEAAGFARHVAKPPTLATLRQALGW